MLHVRTDWQRVAVLQQINDCQGQARRKSLQAWCSDNVINATILLVLSFLIDH